MGTPQAGPLTTEDDIQTFHSAVRWGKTSGQIQKLVQSLGATMEEAVSVKDPENGNEALHIAGQNGHEGLIEFLLSRRADVNSKNNHGHTPLHMSVEYDLYFASRRLMQHGADQQAKNDAGHEAIVGMHGTKTGVEAWDNPMNILIGAENSEAEMEEAFEALEAADPTSLDKAKLVNAGLHKKKTCPQYWDHERLKCILDKIPDKVPAP